MVKKKSAPVKKAAVKKAPVKSASVKKAPVKKGAAKKAPVKKSAPRATGKPGRPEGPLYVPEFVECMKTTPYSRVTAAVQVDGYGSAYFRASEDGAPSLKRLVELIQDSDPKLLKLIKPPKV